MGGIYEQLVDERALSSDEPDDDMAGLGDQSPIPAVELSGIPVAHRALGVGPVHETVGDQAGATMNAGNRRDISFEHASILHRPGFLG